MKSRFWTNEKLSFMVAWLSSVSVSCFRVQSGKFCVKRSQPTCAPLCSTIYCSFNLKVGYFLSTGHFLGVMPWLCFFLQEPLFSSWLCYTLTITIKSCFTDSPLLLGFNGFSMILLGPDLNINLKRKNGFENQHPTSSWRTIWPRFFPPFFNSMSELTTKLVYACLYILIDLSYLDYLLLWQMD